MRNKTWYYFGLAAEAATRKDDIRHYNLGAVGIRGDGATVSTCNGPSPTPNREMHAECRLTKMLDYDAIVYVARVLKNGEYGMAMPCHSCIKALKSRRVKKVYFTRGGSDFGILYLS